jgi:hypothetical protein
LASGRRILPPRSTAYIFPHIVVRNQQKSKKEVKITTAAESKEQNDVTTNQNTTTPTSPSCDPEVIFATIGLLFFGLPLLAGLLIWIVWIIKNTYDLIVEILNCSEQETTNQPSRPSVGRKRGGWYHL